MTMFNSVSGVFIFDGYTTMWCFLIKFINTCFAAMLLSQVKLNTTDYTDLHR